MLDCRDVLRELNDYLDDQAAADLRRELEAHVALCRPCRVVVDSARQVVRIVTESRSFDLPPRISARIMETIRAASRGEPRK